MPSWVACLATFLSEWPDLLGRWGASRAEGYIRTHKRRVTLMQDAVAKRFRESQDPHFDFGEDYVHYEVLGQEEPPHFHLHRPV